MFIPYSLVTGKILQILRNPLCRIQHILSQNTICNVEGLESRAAVLVVRHPRPVHVQQRGQEDGQGRPPPGRDVVLRPRDQARDQTQPPQEGKHWKTYKKLSYWIKTSKQSKKLFS